MRRISIIIFLLSYFAILFPSSSEALNYSNIKIDKQKSKITANVKVAFFHKFITVLKDYTYDFKYSVSERKIIKADFSFDLTDLKTGINARDRKMLRWLQNEKFPRAEFKLMNSEIKKEKYHVKGLFQLHGIRKEIIIISSITTKGKQIKIDGETEFLYTDYDLSIIRMLLLKVKPKLKIKFHFEGAYRSDI